MAIGASTIVLATQLTQRQRDLGCDTAAGDQVMGRHLPRGLWNRWRHLRLQPLATKKASAAKEPKTKAGQRLIRMPDQLVAILRAHRLDQMQLRMKLGQGKLPDEFLQFADLEDNPSSAADDQGSRGIECLLRGWQEVTWAECGQKLGWRIMRHLQTSLIEWMGGRVDEGTRCLKTGVGASPPWVRIPPHPPSGSARGRFAGLGCGPSWRETPKRGRATVCRS